MAEKYVTGRQRRRSRHPGDEGEQVVVLGLGRFGGAVAAEATRLGFDVLGIDTDDETVRHYVELVTHVVQADTTNGEALRQLGVAEFTHAVVAIGTDIEASILTTAALDDLGVGNIWAKAVTRSHGKILERVGANHVVYPEHDMGHRVAHLLGGRIIDWFELDEEFAMVETTVPNEMIGQSLGDGRIRERYGVTVVCVKPEGESFTYATPDTVLKKGSVLVVAGPNKKAEAFAHLD